MKHNVVLPSLLLGMLLSVLACAQTDLLRVTDAWIRAGPPGISALAGYMTLENTSDKDIKIVGAESPQFATIELHHTIIEKDIARMREQPYWIVPASGKFISEPNGAHLMMMMPHSPLQRGDTVQITLRLNSTITQEVVATLR